jgi:hypothetical protein
MALTSLSLFTLKVDKTFIEKYMSNIVISSSTHARLVNQLPSPSPAVIAAAAHQVAIVQFVEGGDQIYGVYSIQKQMIKYNIKATHVVIVLHDTQQSLRDAIALWIGEENLRVVDKYQILDKLKDDSNLWQGVFNKLFAFNLTEFEKIIVLDGDILIRTDITHWFDYPTPCAITSGDDLNWNSGAMVITPDSKIFQQMLRRLPDLRRYDVKETYRSDPMTGGYSDQEFITAFFLGIQKNANNRNRCVMPTEAAVLSSSLEREPFSYFNDFHPWMYETIHFTVHKPWRGYTMPDHPFVCSMLREWNETMQGVEKYYDLIPPLEHDYLQNCG